MEATMGINSKNLFKLLQKPNANKLLARTEIDIITELNNVLSDTKILISSKTIEEACKYILWHGILNNFGTLGKKRDEAKKEHYNEIFSRGTILSIDFGLSNIGKEFAYTHTAIVMADYTGFVIVIPLTSIKITRLEKIPQDIKDDIILVLKKDYSFLEDDSYILTHHIRSVSKNRITKVINHGTFNKQPIMEQIESILFKRTTPYLRKLNNEKIEGLQLEVAQLKQIIAEQQKKLDNKED
jgi:uncharacterized protein YifN (PemK superfamily)